MDEMDIAAASARSSAVFSLQHNHGLQPGRDFELVEGPGRMEVLCNPGHKQVIEQVLSAFDLLIPVVER